MTAAEDASGAYAPERLYGVPHAEALWDDPAAVYEQDIEPYSDGDERQPRIIEEWTVHPPDYHFPSADRLVEWLVEWAADQGELDWDGAERLEKQAEHVTVTDAAENLLAALAARITYRMADRKVAEHIVTWSPEGEPLLDGFPLYRPSHSADSGASGEVGR